VAVPQETAASTGEQELSRSERKAAARGETVETDETPQEKHLRRQQERREAKSRAPERPTGMKRLVNTERFDGVQRFSNDTASEIRKVNWPDRESTRNLTIVVIALSTILGLALGGIDYVLYQLFEAMT
jgi:preprotein translocase subunit SecE